MPNENITQSFFNMFNAYTDTVAVSGTSVPTYFLAMDKTNNSV